MQRHGLKALLVRGCREVHFGGERGRAEGLVVVSVSSALKMCQEPVRKGGNSGGTAIFVVPFFGAFFYFRRIL